MKRDMDLMRSLLLLFEDSDRATLAVYDISDVLSPLHQEPEIEFHLTLMHEGNLLQYDWQGYHPTIKGYDFLDMVRDPEIWEQTKEGAKKFGGFTGEVLLALAKGFIKEKLEKHTGVEIDL